MTETLKTTYSICPDCNQIATGAIVQSGDDILINVDCQNHHHSEGFITPNSNFYREILNIIRNNFLNSKNLDNNPVCRISPVEKHITSVHINITDKCNLKCPYCFASADSNREIRKDIDLDEIQFQLKPYQNRKNKPMLVLIGGEPTLREDLTSIIHRLHKEGYNVRLSTNGLMLQNNDLVLQYKKAGLSWVLLQFDGFSSKSSISLRGKDLTEQKKIVLENLKQNRIKTHLIMMVSKDINHNEIFKTILYAFEQPEIYALNLYPQSLTGRYQENATYAIDCIEYIENQSNGTITKQDFIDCKRIWQFLYRVTKKPIFRQNLCTFPIFLVRVANHLYSINRLFSFHFFVLNPLQTLKLLMNSWRLLFWEHIPNKNFLYLNIEKFYHSKLLDLTGAYDCHNVFLTKDGFIPLCIYNSIYRPKKCY